MKFGSIFIIFMSLLIPATQGMAAQSRPLERVYEKAKEVSAKEHGEIFELGKSVLKERYRGEFSDLELDLIGKGESTGDRRQDRRAADILEQNIVFAHQLGLQ